MSLNFEKYAQTGTHFMKELSAELGYEEEPQKSARILKSVLHTLRDHLTLEESLQLLSQLPMFLKGIYVDGWTNHKKKKVKDLDEFIYEVWEKDGMTADIDFGDGQETLADAIIVFLLLRKYVSEGEMNDIVTILPKELKPLVNPSFAS